MSLPVLTFLCPPSFIHSFLTILPLCVLAKISKVVKNSKVKINHLGHWRKTKDLGPRSDDPYSAFNLDGDIDS